MEGGPPGRAGGSTVRYCGACGDPCPAHNKYCTLCGAPLHAPSQSAPPSASSLRTCTQPSPSLSPPPPQPTSSSPSSSPSGWGNRLRHHYHQHVPSHSGSHAAAGSSPTAQPGTSVAASRAALAAKQPGTAQGRNQHVCSSSTTSSSPPSGSLLWPPPSGGRGHQLKRTHSAENVRRDAATSSPSPAMGTSTSTTPTSGGAGGTVKSRWPPVTTYATMRPSRAGTAASASARSPSGWSRSRDPSLVSSMSSTSTPGHQASSVNGRPSPSPVLSSLQTSQSAAASTAPASTRAPSPPTSQSRPQEAGQALWSKVQVGLRAAIDDARRRGSSGGDVFTLAQAQEKHTLALRSQNDSFTFRQYAPAIFRSLRKHYGISDEAYLNGLCGEVQELGFQGKSGSFLFVSGDNELVIKTISVNESKYLRKLLLAYYEHTTHPTEKSFLVRFVGMYRINAAEQATILVMTNAFGKAERIDERYDLKGSTLGRKTLFSCKLDAPVAGLMLKDLDLVDRFRIKLGRERKKRFLHMLTYDAEFLERFGIIDYSLLLGVHFVDSSEEHKRPRGPLSADVLHAEDGGIWSSNDQREALRAIYYCAVIDILQPYNMRKQLEHNLKAVVHDKQAISVCPPTKYVSRFLHFISTYIE